MADPTSNDLPYGHFGRATYDPDEQTWSFERNAGAADVLRPLGKPRLIAKPSEHPDAPASPGSSQPKTSERHAKEIRELIKRFPDVQPASGLLPQLLRVSEAVTTATARHDSLKGGLLAIGTIPTEAHHDTISVAAFSSGPTENDVRIVQIQSQRRGWANERGAWLRVPTIHGEEAFWSGGGVPIQQICFAHAIERADTFLAVRMLTRTLIFRPTQQDQPTRASSASRLDLKPCFEIHIKRTGGLPHADVAFNPWYTRQFGVVDQAGSWVIWELHGRGTTSGKLVCQGRMNNGPSETTNAVHDGWARIAWVCNPDTVAICTRRQLTFYTINGTDSPSAATVIWEIYPEAGWNLAMVAVPSQPAYLAILTSTHLILYHTEEIGPDLYEVRIALRTRHYRNPEDITLSLDAFAAKEGVLVILRSGVEPMVTMYRLRFERGIVRAAVPAVLTLPDSMATPGNGATIAGLHFGDVAFRFGNTRSEDSLASQYKSRGIAFASLTILGKDQSLQEVLYSSAPAGSLSVDAAPPTWESRLKTSAARLRKESFVVDDDEVDAVHGEESEPVSLYQQLRRSRKPTRDGPEWTVSLKLSAQALENSEGFEKASVDDVTETAEALLRDPKTDATLPWRTLRDLVLGELSLDDIEESSTRLDSLAQVERRPEEPSQTEPEEAQSNMQFTLRITSSQPTTNLKNVHDDMVRDWITPLSPEISDGQRSAKEQLVRRAAAEVSLASRLIGVQPLGQSEPEFQPSQESFDLPLRAGPASSQYTAPSSQAASQSSVLPTPSPTGTPSTTTGSSHPSTFVAPEIARLSRYTTFSKLAPSALPRSLNNVLKHWTVGADPVEYDWRASSRRVAEREDDEVDEQMTEKERARVQRRAERHIKRQRREVAASQAAQLASSQALQIMSASQPQQVVKTESQPGAGNSQTQSQSQGLGAAPASQVVPGRFGGRPPKKKRKQGF